MRASQATTTAASPGQLVAYDVDTGKWTCSADWLKILFTYIHVPIGPALDSPPEVLLRAELSALPRPVTTEGAVFSSNLDSAMKKSNKNYKQNTVHRIDLDL